MLPHLPHPPIVLTMAASDPTGGAGIQGDLTSIASFGCHALSVITALTVQDSAGIENTMAVDCDWLEDQARSILEDMPVRCFKIGALGSIENIAVAAEIVADYPDIPLVLHPALVSGHDDQLIDEDMFGAMHELLLPQTTLVAMNSLEARRFCACLDEDEPSSIPPFDECARRLLEAGCEYALLTGMQQSMTTMANELHDRNGRVLLDEWNRLPGSFHGAGCTLSASIAACMACGLDMEEAVRQAQKYTWQTLATAFRPGMGKRLPNRFFWTQATAQNEGNAN